MRMNRKGRSKYNKFVMLRYDMMDSLAYRSLSPAARCVWQEIRRRYNGFNNGDIPLSCREAGEFVGIGKDTACRAFYELMGRGFVKIGQDNAFNVKTRFSRRWILTDYPREGRPPSNEWRKWDPENLEHGPATGTGCRATGTDGVVIPLKRT